MNVSRAIRSISQSVPETWAAGLVEQLSLLGFFTVLLAFVQHRWV